MGSSDAALRIGEIGRRVAAGCAPVVLLTGAGISAESGIPTFRGREGYWQVGSREYRPMELATWEAFQEVPDDVWGWYLYRRAVCRAARPNAAHEAVAALERALGDRFVLVTQNVDGLHLRTGNSSERTYQIHGNIYYMRCARECRGAVHPLPVALGESWEKGRLPDARELALLRCPDCEGPARPHVLWFDEAYDEARFRFESSVRAAVTTDLLIVVGTSGATNLPTQMCEIVARRGAALIVIDTTPTVFCTLAERSRAGVFLQGSACERLPALLERVARWCGASEA